MSDALDTEEVFLETSVLVDFAQEGKSSDCFRLYQSHSGRRVTSPYVKIEFERKKTNREFIVEYFQSKIGAGDHDFDDFSPPEKDHLNVSDIDYARGLIGELAAAESVMDALKELSTRRSRFRNIHHVLFEKDGGVLHVFSAEADAYLLGMLSGVIGNQDDERILAEAIDWADTKGRETLLTYDRRDIADNENQINRVIERCRDFEQELSIFLLDNFLRLIDS